MNDRFITGRSNGRKRNSATQGAIDSFDRTEEEGRCTET